MFGLPKEETVQWGPHWGRFATANLGNNPYLQMASQQFSTSNSLHGGFTGNGLLMPTPNQGNQRGGAAPPAKEPKKKRNYNKKSQNTRQDAPSTAPYQLPPFYQEFPAPMNLRSLMNYPTHFQLWPAAQPTAPQSLELHPPEDPSQMTNPPSASTDASTPGFKADAASGFHAVDDKVESFWREDVVGAQQRAMLESMNTLFPDSFELSMTLLRELQANDSAAELQRQMLKKFRASGHGAQVGAQGAHGAQGAQFGAHGAQGAYGAQGAQFQAHGARGAQAEDHGAYEAHDAQFGTLGAQGAQIDAHKAQGAQFGAHGALEVQVGAHGAHGAHGAQFGAQIDALRAQRAQIGALGALLAQNGDLEAHESPTEAQGATPIPEEPTLKEPKQEVEIKEEPISREPTPAPVAPPPGENIAPQLSAFYQPTNDNDDEVIATLTKLSAEKQMKMLEKLLEMYGPRVVAPAVQPPAPPVVVSNESNVEVEPSLERHREQRREARAAHEAHRAEREAREAHRVDRAAHGARDAHRAGRDDRGARGAHQNRNESSRGRHQHFDEKRHYHHHNHKNHRRRH